MSDLTIREREVLGLIALGETNHGVSLRLGIKLSTVKLHVAAIMDKLGAVSRAQAVYIAMRLGEL